MQTILQRKTRQEQLRKEKRQIDVLHDIKDIFVEAFDILYVNDNQTIVEQLVHIVDKVNTKDIDANTKLIDWSYRKYHQGDSQDLR